MSERGVTKMQDVYDLIISTCQDDPEFHARGASALRYLNGYERKFNRLLADRVRQKGHA